MGKSQVKRFCVDKECLDEFRSNLDLYEPQIRAEGWWIAADLPPELRALRSTAFKFFKEAKSLHDTIRMAYLDVAQDSGYVTIDGIDLVPVYMVPRDTKKWPALITLMSKIVDSVRAIEWTERVTSKVQIDQSLVREWTELIGAKVPTKENSSDIHMVDSEDGG